MMYEYCQKKIDAGLIIIITQWTVTTLVTVRELTVPTNGALILNYVKVKRALSYILISLPSEV